MQFPWISSEISIFSVTLLAMYHLILMEKGLFMWRAPRAMIDGICPPLCVPLRALEWGYDCFALRAMSLRDGIPSYALALRAMSLRDGIPLSCNSNFC